MALRNNTGKTTQATVNSLGLAPADTTARAATLAPRITPTPVDAENPEIKQARKKPAPKKPSKPHPEVQEDSSTAEDSKALNDSQNSNTTDLALSEDSLSTSSLSASVIDSLNNDSLNTDTTQSTSVLLAQATTTTIIAPGYSNTPNTRAAAAPEQTSTSQSGMGWGIWAGAGAGAVVGALALGGGNGGGNGDGKSTDATPTNPPTPPILFGPAVTIQNIGLGPLITNDPSRPLNLTATVYAADGKTRMGTGSVDAQGKAHFTLDYAYNNYSGAAIVKITGTASYQDEATNRPKHFDSTTSGPMLAALVLIGGGAVTVNVNPLTTFAAIEAGVQPDGSVDATKAAFTADTVKAASTQVARLVGLTGDNAGDRLIQITPIFAIGNSVLDGANLSTSSDAAKVGTFLALVSGLEKSRSTAATAVTTKDVIKQLNDSFDSTKADMDGKAIAPLLLEGAGQVSVLGNSVNGYVFDKFQLITVGIQSDKPQLKVGDTANITFTFSVDPGSTFDATDIVSVGGSLGTLSGSGTTRTATFTPDSGLDSGTASITVKANSYTGAGGTVNNGQAGSSPIISYDTKAPSLAITSSASAVKVGETATITFTFSEDPGTSFVASDIVTTGGTLAGLSATGLVRTAIFTPMPGIDSTTASITVATGNYTDTAGNDGGAGTAPMLSVDTKAPMLTSASVQGTSTVTLTFDTDLDSNAFTGITQSNINSLFSFKTSASRGGTYAAVNNAYTAISVTGSAVILTLGNTAYISEHFAKISYTDIASDQSTGVVQDVVGNDLASFTDNAVITTPVIFGFAVSDTVSSNGTTLGKAGEAVTVAVSFSENVTLTASKTYTVRVQVGSNTSDYMDATLVTAVGTQTASSTHNFSGTLPSTTGLSTSALQLTSLTVPAGASIVVGSQTLIKTTYTLTSTAYTVDSLVPTVSSIALVAKDDKSGQSYAVLNAGDTVDVAVTFSEAVTITGSPTVTLNVGGVNRTATFVGSINGTTSSKKFFRYTVAAGDTDANGISIDANALTLNGGSITDTAGNTATITHAFVADNSAFSIDTNAPAFSSGATAPARAENSAAGSVVYFAVATDSAATISYSLKANTGDVAAFSINSSTGAVTLTGSPDFETKPSYSFTVIAADAAGNASERAVTLAVTNVDDTAPTFSSGSIATAIAENSAAGQLVYTAAATDTDFPGATGSVSYSLKANTGDVANFTINSNTGAVTLTGSPDFEAKPSYSFTVIATDAAGNASERAVTLAVTNVDDTAPTFSSGATATAIAENSSASQVVYTAVATDSAATISYSLKPGTGDVAAFSINSSTGAVTLTGSPDFEAKSSYSFTVIATDAAGNASERAVTLAVTNVDDMAPTFTSGTAATSIQQPIPALGEVVYTAAATDTDFIAPNTASSVTYSLKPNVGDASAFAIDGSTGEVMLTGSLAGKSSYNFTVIATDAAGNAREQIVSKPPAVGSLQWLLGKAVNPVANLAEASTGAVLFQSTEVDTMVKVTFTDSASHSLVKSVRSTGKIQAVTLEASDFGTGTGQLSNGNITVTATVNDVAGNAVDGYAKSIENNGVQTPSNTRSFTLDVTAPQVQTNTTKVVDKILILQLDEALATDAAHKPNLTDFTVTVDGNSNAVTAIRILGSSLELTLTDRVAPGATVSLSYTAPTTAADSSSGPLQDKAGNPLANISNLSITDSTPDHPVITSIVLTDNSPTTKLQQFFGNASAGGHTATVTFSEPVNIAGGSVTIVFGDKNDPTRSITGTIAADASGTFSATKDVAFTGVLPTLSNVEFMLDLLSVSLGAATTIRGNTIANGGSNAIFDAANPSIGDIHTGYTADYIKPEVIDKGADIYAVDSSNVYINPLDRSALKAGDKIVLEVPWNGPIASIPTDPDGYDELKNYRIRLGGFGESENGVLKRLGLDETFPGTTPSKKFFTYTIVAGDTDSDGIDAEYRTLQQDGQTPSPVIDLAGNENRTSLHPLDKIYHIPTLKVDTTAPTLDLNGSLAVGNNTMTTIPNNIDVSNFNSDTAILPDVTAVSHADVMKIVLDFADTAATNAPKSGDRLKIGSINGYDADIDLYSASNLSHTTGGLTLGGQSGLDYTYDEATNKLTLFKHDGTAFAAAKIDAALKAIQFKNADSQVVAGTRDFDVHLFDHAGNDGLATAQFVVQPIIG